MATVTTAVATLATTTEQAVAARAAVTSVNGSATVAVRNAVATVATTTMAAVTGDRLLLAAHQGQPNNREQNRDSQN
ncbi:MAG: hypothetical protein WDZ59_04055 [Pirellulales bacterium]